MSILLDPINYPGLLNNLMTMLPEQAEKLQEAVEHIDADKVIKMTEVIKDKD